MSTRAIREALKMLKRDHPTQYEVVADAEAEVEAIETRLKNREEMARRIYASVWLEGSQAVRQWGECSPEQRAFWLKAAENVEAFVLTGTSPDGGDHTPVARVLGATEKERREGFLQGLRVAAGIAAERGGDVMPASEVGEAIMARLAFEEAHPKT